MKTGEIWKNKKGWGPSRKVKIVSLKDEMIKYVIIFSDDTILDNNISRRVFLLIYEKDYDENRFLCMKRTMMKVGETWIRKYNETGFENEDIRGEIVRITRLYYFDLDNQDYVEYDIIKEHIFFADKYKVIAAGIERNKFLQIFERSQNESR